MLTPWSSCKPCLCLWPSDSHDPVSLKNAPSQQTSVLFFPVIIPNAQLSPVYYHMVALSFDDPSTRVLCHLWTAEDHHEGPRALLSFLQSCQQRDTNCLFSVNRTWGGAWEDQESHSICNPLFQISSPVGSGSFQIHVHVYLWAILVLCEHRNSGQNLLGCLIPWSNTELFLKVCCLVIWPT